jgi:nucleoside-diphosphate-sugar epimerase
VTTTAGSAPALDGVKILVTGASGNIGLPLAEYLAPDNDVWAIARFTDPAARGRLAAAGATTVAVDLGTDELDRLPDDFDHVIHLATFGQGGLDFDAALQMDAVGTGMLLAQCRRARSALVMSTGAVYRPADDPTHAYAETDPLGDAGIAGAPAYSVSKISQEAVARTCARLYGLPVVIGRMNSAYGANGGLVAWHLDRIMAAKPVRLAAHGIQYSPIHQDDINLQLPSMLRAASVPATIVNWGGDEVFGPDEWCAYAAELADREVEIVAGDARGYSSCIYDVRKRLAITGPCTVTAREGARRTLDGRYPDR